MSMNTPIGGITQITPIKNFQEISELDNEQYLLGIKDSSTGSGGKVKFETLISDSISENNDNIITTGTDGKLLVNTPPQIGNLSNLTTTNKSTLVAAINEVDGDVGNLANLTTSVKTNIVNAINSEVSARGTAETNIQNDYNGKIGTLSNLDTTYKSNLVGAINEIAAIAEPSLQYETMNNSKALETGSLSTDTTILADIQKYAHSTFDLSKFTVVGSPIITNNGIASGFSTSNYINSSISATTPQNELIVKSRVIYSTADNYAEDQKVIFNLYDGTNDWRLAVNRTGGNIFLTGNNRPPLGFGATHFNLTDGDVIDAELKVTKTQFALTVSINGGTPETTTAAYETVFYSISNILIGHNSTTGGNYYWTGSFDLKQFSITVDGVPVFSGNKTGIDTIKPDDYTVVGTPTISTDGIASGFSASNYIITPASTIDLSKPWQIKGIVTFTSFPAAACPIVKIIGDTQDYRRCLYYNNNNNTINYNYKLIGETSERGFSQPFTPVLGQKYEWSIGWTGTRYYINIGNAHAHYDSTTLLDIATSKRQVYLGIQPETAATWGGFTGSIDLNAFKIYEYSDLVYQPCLRIPYTLSHSGSKIADAIYRDRVIDAYEQGYDYRYYTLSDTDFTLPMGEIYGDIENCLNVNTATQAEKNAVMGWGVPDYSRAVAFNPTSGQAVGFNGWLQANAHNTAENQWFTASINNIPFLSTAGGSQGGVPDAASNVVPVKADDVLTFTNVGNYGFNKIPYVGGNL